MKEYTHTSKYFYGNKISDYGLKNGYVDYKTLAAAFDAVLCNDIAKLFFGEINGEFSEAEQVNGFIDNSDEIERLREDLDEAITQYNEAETGSEQEQNAAKKWTSCRNKSTN